MAYWDSIVRIRGPRAVGTGCFIQPNLVLTAAHVLMPKIQDEWSAEDTRNTKVTSLYGLKVTLPARNVFFLDGWRAEREPDHDMCLIDVSPLLTAGLKTRRYFGEQDDSYEVAVLGYPWADGSEVEPHYSTGKVKRRGTLFWSAEFAYQDGVSGAPFLVEEEEGRVDVVGVATAAPSSQGDDVAIGLPLLDKNFGGLLTQANTLHL